MTQAEIYGIVYVAMAFLVGTLVWLMSKHTWDPKKDSLASHVARVVVVMVALGAMWPSTLIMVAIWKTPWGNRWLRWWLAGPPSASDEDD